MRLKRKYESELIATNNLTATAMQTIFGFKIKRLAYWACALVGVCLLSIAASQSNKALHTPLVISKGDAVKMSSERNRKHDLNVSKATSKLTKNNVTYPLKNTKVLYGGSLIWDIGNSIFVEDFETQINHESKLKFIGIPIQDDEEYFPIKLNDSQFIVGEFANPDEELPSLDVRQNAMIINVGSLIDVDSSLSMETNLEMEDSKLMIGEFLAVDD